MKKLTLVFLLFVGLVSNVLAGPAPESYYWDVRYVDSTLGGWEDTYGKSITTENHGGTVRAYVLVGGYSNSILATFNNSVMQMTDSEPVDFNGDNIIDGFWYEFTGTGNSGNIEIYDVYNFQWGIRDRMYVR